MPATTEQAVIMLASHFYESRDGSTGGFFADNTNAAQQVWNTVNLLYGLTGIGRCEYELWQDEHLHFHRRETVHTG